MMLPPSERPLQAKLHGARTMRIQRVQKGSPGDAVCSPFSLKSGRIHGTGIATDDVVSATAWIIGVVDTELGVIEKIENLSTKLNLAPLGELKVPEQRHIEVPAAGIIQEVSASVAKRQSSRRYKLRWVSQQWAKALRIVRRSGQSGHHVGVRRRDAETARDASIVGQRNSGVAGTVDDRERSTRLNERDSRDLPATENVVHDHGTAVSGGL